MKMTNKKIGGLICGILLSVVSVHADREWNGNGNNSDWFNSANWGGSGNYVIDSTNNSPILTGTYDSIIDIRTGNAGGKTGILTIDSGTLSVTNLICSSNNGTGTILVKGSGFLTHLGTGGDPRVFVSNAGGSGYINITDSGSMAVLGSKTAFMVGNQTNANGAISIDKSGYLYTSATAIIGNSGMGSLSLADSGRFDSVTEVIVGNNTTGKGTVTVADSAVIDAPKLTLGKSGGIGTVNLNGGTIQTSSIAVGATGSGTLNASGGKLRATTDNANYLDKVNVNLQSGGLVVDTDGHAVGITNILSGAGGLTKVGSGTLTLTGASTYAGKTSVQGGTLLVNSTLSGGGEVALSGGTLAIGDGLNLNFGALEVSGNVAIEFLGSGASLKFANSSAVAWSGALTLDYEVARAISFTSSGGLSQSQWGLINVAGYTVTGLDNSGFLEMQAVPEPSALVLLTVGVAILGVCRMRRRG